MNKDNADLNEFIDKIKSYDKPIITEPNVSLKIYVLAVHYAYLNLINYLDPKFTSNKKR